VIHIATVHWRSDRWIDLQCAALQRYTGEPFRIYAFLDNVDRAYDRHFFYISREPIRVHPIKLNLLADVIRFHAQPDDLLIFVDGDAWPVRDYVPFIREQLSRVPLIAVRRSENGEDKQPHPSFAATTVGFWQRLGGDWHAGYTWDAAGANGATTRLTDIGGNLLGRLRDQQIDWLPLLRSNTVNLHPLWFGIYGNIVYHHGAGFRFNHSRADAQVLASRYPFGMWLNQQQNPAANLLLTVLGYRRRADQYHREVADLSHRMAEKLTRDPDFVHRLIDRDASEAQLRRELDELSGML
jgi:hypothetical protein